jgi:carnitine monooxygenase subunit
MAFAAATRSIPWDWYHDPAALRLERERLFASHWQYVVHDAELLVPGSFSTAILGHVPIVLVRGRDDVLRGFVNVCRHRGYLLCEGSGRRETLQCPYHAWTYDLDGALRSAPRSDREPAFEAEGLGLVPILLEQWGPFVFANLDPSAGPLADALGDVPRLVAESGVDVDTLAFHVRAEGSYAANWKVCVENFLECYHCQIAHPSFSKAIDVAPDAYLLEQRGLVSTQWGPPKHGGGGVYDAGGKIARGQFHFLFPGTVVNVMPGRPNLSIGPVLPLAAERTDRYLDYFFAPDADADWIADYLGLDEQVGAEDRVLVERVQLGVRSGAILEGALLPEAEQLIGHFERLLVEALGADA